MADLKKLTLLHSNDMHGDFLAQQMDDKLLGGVSMLSGYLNKVRKEEKNVLYAIAGDMLSGSLIDSEYKGISTIEITNLLAPDVVTLGNHEVDYGVGHLLFLEKCAKFPIINANMYMEKLQKRMFASHWVARIDDMRILFIGVLTENVLAQTSQETLIGPAMEVKDAVEEIGKICNSYRTEYIDLTVLLTHVGFEEDKKLAAALDPCWGVDLIIGGHSHTYMEEPTVVAGIPIVQAACGTDQIGRFDILVNTQKNCVDSFQWKLIPINDEHCPRDLELEKLIRGYQEETDAKYNRVITRFADAYTHPARNQETQLGRIFSDIYRESLGVDIMFLGSGGIRSKEMGPIVRFEDLRTAFSFDEALYRVTLNGEQLRRAITWILREEAFTAHTEFYQFSGGLHIVWSREKQQIQSLEYEGKPVTDDQRFRVGLHAYHYRNMDKFLQVSLEESEENEPSRKGSTSSCDVLEEWMKQKELIADPRNVRLVIRD